MINSETYRFKIVVVGDGAVGKTSLIKKFTKGTFERDYVKTIGAQFSKYNKKVADDLIRLVFWDIAGQEDFNFLQPLFYKESKAAIIVYSLEKNTLGKKSFTHIKDWYEVVEKNCGDIPIVLFANKVDLIDENAINKSKIQKLVNDYRFLNSFLTSAKTGQGVVNAFNVIIERLYVQFKTA
ncbi:MAG: GTP-binding protein [Promethearchaeota archaeon]|nr:MAG: GTP-binding protein [Candidatus Lokiarchaeota archaeon]